MTTRRASLPGAEELFRRTSDAPEPEVTPVDQAESPDQSESKAPSLQVAKETESRPRHDEKVTFYCTGEELTRLERARLSLRANHRLASDRGRIVRASLAEILDDFEARGANSALVKRLQQD